ncbi:hypothetical protein HPP92_018324 [Vanilla planifolia]|uniref:NAD-dependent epimerase/dehydratase domain-containing protein n=1 Tax=Vanilla planifolia TaxID=51239 RepID=A0A835Q9L2_VANPL|nr:hypothetical protein HPP92_018324 [Vanilla planifolia]
MDACRVCVTGAGGFVASWLVKLLLSNGYKVNGTSEVIAPAVTGTLNVLKACSEVGVRRVILVSSVMSVMKNPKWPKDEVMDESCWTDEEYYRNIKGWYGLAKTLAERAAWEYAGKTGLNMVTVCPAMVLGPLLQPTGDKSASEVLEHVDFSRAFVEEVKFIAKQLFFINGEFLKEDEV